MFMSYLAYESGCLALWQVEPRTNQKQGEWQEDHLDKMDRDRYVWSTICLSVWLSVHHSFCR